MGMVQGFFDLSEDRKARTAIFLSGSGSNAERVLARYAKEKQAGHSPCFEIVALVTDAPETSRAVELGGMYGLPVVSEDIAAFYRANGATRVTIATEEGRRIRQEWTDRLREKLAPLHIDFAIFAGFVPLTNLTADFPCLNVHPGDLTYLKDGARYLVGLHTIPVERAILEGLEVMRSSVIQAIPYTGRGDDMDNGAILGISSEVEIDLCGHSLEELVACQAARPAKRPVGGYQDALAEVAKVNQEKLKEQGDWVVLPRVVWDFAAGRFGKDEQGGLMFRLAKDKWLPIETVIYSENSREPVFR